MPTDQPTVGPTAEPSITSSTEPTLADASPTATATNEPEIGIAAEPGVSIQCLSGSTPGAPGFRVIVGEVTLGDPPPTVTITGLDETNRPIDPPIVYESYDSGDRFFNTTYREIVVTADYPDSVETPEDEYVAEASCYTSQNQPVITTSAVRADDTAIPNGGRVEAGEPFGDTATISNITIDAAGTITYNLYTTADCSGSPVFTDTQPIAYDEVADTVRANPSALYTPVESGLYRWQVVYTPEPGDELNAPGISGCDDERVIVDQVQPTIDTIMTRTDTGQVIPQNGAIPLDSGVTDTAVLSGTSDAPTGDVVFALYATADCSGEAVFTATIPLDGATTVTSDTFSPTTPGTYNWVVTYAGDDANAEAESGCGEETFEVLPNEPTITTVMRDAATNAVIPDGGTVNVESTISDEAILGGATADAGGTMTYNLYLNTTCTGTPVFTTTQPVTGSDAPTSGTYQFAEPGTYNWQVVYSGDTRNSSATSQCGTETVNVCKLAPTLTTTIRDGQGVAIPNRTLLPNPSDVGDSAELSGGSATPSGTVTYFLHNSFNCAGTATQYGPYDLNSDGTLPSVPPVTLTQDGTYNWVVQYSGDALNDPATSRCGIEQFYIGQGSGGITTVMVRDPSQVRPPEEPAIVADEAQVAFDTAIRDRAVIDGITPTATGTVTFTLYGDNTCTEVVQTFGPYPITPGGTVFNAGPTEYFTFATQGTYNWVASYSGDANNQPITTPCGLESINVGGQYTNVTTAMFAEENDTAIADNAGILVGTGVYDTAVIGRTATDDAGGTVTYNLYANAACSGTPVFTSGPHPVTNKVAERSAPFTIAEPVVYNWQVVYSGDANNRPSTSACGTETIIGQVQPTITTQPRIGSAAGEPIADDSVLPYGTGGSDTSVVDTAALGGASATTGGTVTYNLYRSTGCSGTPIFSQTVRVNNGIVPATNATAPYFVGTYNWQAVYSGDTHNRAVTSECGLETFVVQGPLTIQTIIRAGSPPQVVGPNGNIFVNLPVTDDVIIRGTTADASGTVTYQLFDNDTCDTAPVFSSTKTMVNGVVPRSDPYTPVEAGRYNWVVTYSGDGQNAAIASNCGDEPFNVIPRGVQRSLEITCTYNGNNRSTFTVRVSKLNGTEPDTDPNLTVVVTPLLLDLSTGTPQTVRTYVTTFENQPWRRLNVQVTWPDGGRGRASAGCNAVPLRPTIATTMSTSGGTAIPQNGVVGIGTEVVDATTLSGATVTFGGTIRYRLYASGDCSGTPLLDETKPIVNSTIPPSSPVVATAVGPYNWVVDYSGDRNNRAISSPCGRESFFVSPDVSSTTELTTSAQVESETESGTWSAVADGGTIEVGRTIRDTATITGLREGATGSVTYELYNGTSCDDPDTLVATTTVSLAADGTVPPSDPYTPAAPGTYEWLVRYTGDADNPGASSVCGAETVVIGQRQPTITTTLSAESVSVGDDVFDSATLNNVTGNVSGTVTYVIYAGTTCDTEPLASFEVTIGQDGTIPDSGAYTFETAGTYQWQAVYGGDTNNAPATSECGTEELTVLANGLSIAKTSDTAGEGEDSVYAGETIGFTITVTNAGPGIARNVVITDILASVPGLAWSIDAAGTTADCAIELGVLRCAAEDLAAGADLTVHITSPTKVESCGTVTNEASYASDNGGNGTTPVVSVTVDCDIELPVYKISCDTAPGAITVAEAEAGTIPENCEFAAGIAFSVAVDGGDPTSETTDDTGQFTLDAVIGATIVVTETGVPDTYTVVDNPQTAGPITPTSEGLVFVNVLVESGLSLTKYICPADAAGDPIYEVLAPGDDPTLDTSDCVSGAGVTFTIDGENLLEPIEITTDDAGFASLDLPIGDYTITENETGASTAFTVVPDEVVRIRVVNADPEFPGVVTAQKVYCELDEGEEPSMTVTDEVPSGCTPGETEIELQGEPYAIGGSGELEIADLAPGDYTITEPCAGLELDFTLPAGGDVTIVIVNDVFTCAQATPEPTATNTATVVPSPTPTETPGAEPTIDPSVTPTNIAPNPPGGGTGDPETPTPALPGGTDGDGTGGANGEQGTDVTTLPSTGDGPSRAFPLAILAAMLLCVAALAVPVLRRRHG